MPRPSVSREPAPQPEPVGGLRDPGRKIVADELEILRRVHERLVRESKLEPSKMEDLDAALIELRDAIAEAKEEDVPSLIDQMHQVAALSRKRGKGRSLPIDPKNPYFGHLRLKEARSGRQRDVLIGRHTLLDDGDGVTIVDWRNAPVSRLYYRYEEEDEYEEDFDDRTIQGEILVRRSLAVTAGELRRVAAPQGTWAIDREGQWRQAEGSAMPTLQGGSGTAIRYDRGRLGVNEDAALRADKHLQEITALIDKQQFELITRPDSGIVLIQGGAGSGKTTVALHRVAYLAFQDHKRFAPQKMIIVVFNEALVEYIRHVLPSLGVDGVTVTTYRRWSTQLVKRLKLPIELRHSEDTPDAVTRFKKHPAVLRMIDEIVDEQVGDLREQLVEKLSGRARGDEIVSHWDELHRLPPVMRVERLMDWLAEGKGKDVPPRTKAPANTILRAVRETMRDVVADFFELNTSEQRIRTAIRQHAAGQFSDIDVDTIVRWCAKKAELEVDEDGELPETDVGLDDEDDAILLRLMQVKFGGLFLGNKRFEYEHLVIDEAQDLCPLEVRVLLDCVSGGRSVTIAGDRAQKMIFDNGFVDWPQLLGDAGLPHVAVQPLKITYRSTRQVMQLSQHVLGPLHNPEDDLIARDGAPVGCFEFGDQGEAVAFLGEALRGLMQREPSASVALIARYPQQADMYYDALRIAEVPRLRRVRREDFTFTSGIDVTDIRQVKGLEFDYVVILDPTRQNFPDATQARHLMHIAMTRAAFQLWLICAGEKSPLLPPELFDQKAG